MESVMLVTLGLAVAFLAGIAFGWVVAYQRGFRAGWTKPWRKPHGLRELAEAWDKQKIAARQERVEEAWDKQQSPPLAGGVAQGVQMGPGDAFKPGDGLYQPVAKSES